MFHENIHDKSRFSRNRFNTPKWKVALSAGLLAVAAHSAISGHDSSFLDKAGITVPAVYGVSLLVEVGLEQRRQKSDTTANDNASVPSPEILKLPLQRGELTVGQQPSGHLVVPEQRRSE